MSGFLNFLTFSIISFVIGLILCFSSIIYSLKKSKISKVIFSYFCIIPAFVFTLLLTLYLAFNNGKWHLFIFGVFFGNFCFILLYVFYLFIPKKIYRGIELSSGEEYLNLSYLLGLIDKISRFELTELEQDFFMQFKEKIHRMTTFNCYEVPSSFELNRFYFLCKRLGVN